MEGQVIEIVNMSHAIKWGVPIPQYFFFTGISAAAFLISTLTYVFGDERYRPVAGLSLIVAFTVLLAAPLNLIADLGQPGRFWSLLFRQHASSPMSWGVYLLTIYPLLILAEMLFVFRAGFARRAAAAGGRLKSLWLLLAHGEERVDVATEARDHRIGRILGIIGIPLALAVHGYTGYILGVVKARALWHTSLMPLTFLISAMVSGVALMILLSALMVRDREGKLPWALMDRLAVLLGWSIVGDLLIRLLWYSIGLGYSSAPFQDAYHHLFSTHFTQAVALELGLGLVLPLLVAFTPSLRRIRPLFLLTAVLAVAGVWLFRWDTVIGGQQLPKIDPGLTAYAVPFAGREGIMHILGNWAFWLFLFLGCTWVLPWRQEEAAADEDPCIEVQTESLEGVSYEKVSS